MWKLDAQDIEDLATGAAILGTGGGGDPYLGKLMALSVLDKGMEISGLRVVLKDGGKSGRYEAP